MKQKAMLYAFEAAEGGALDDPVVPGDVDGTIALAVSDPSKARSPRSSKK